MTSPTFSEESETSVTSIIDYIAARKNLVAVAGVVVVLAAGGYWFSVRSAQIKAGNAGKALMSAKISLSSGNIALAQADLQKVVERYDGTTAGSEAALLLAQLDYDQQKFAEGVQILEKAIGDAPAPLAAAMRAMIGDGQLELKKPAEAAQAYVDAAGMTPYAGEKVAFQARAARAYLQAGQTDKAKEIWTRMAESAKSPAAAAEAKVRLGELSAKPTG